MTRPAENDAARIVGRDLSPAASGLARREGWAAHARMHPATVAEYEARAASDDGSDR